MSALTAARTNVSNKGKIVQTIGMKCAASQVFFSGALVSVNSAGFLVPASATAGQRIAGWVELDNLVSFTSSAVAGADSLSVRTGIYPVVNGSATDACTQADVLNDVYLLDDQTISRLPGAGRPVAGQLIKFEGTVPYIGIGFATPHDSGAGGSDGTAYQGDGSVDAVAAPGALSVNTEISTLAVDGTDAYTLANGLFLGQRKVAQVISGVNTPVGTITPATAVGFTTVTGLGVIGEACEFVWGGAGAWYLVGLTPGVTVT